MLSSLSIFSPLLEWQVAAIAASTSNFSATLMLPYWRFAHVPIVVVIAHRLMLMDRNIVAFLAVHELDDVFLPELHMSLHSAVLEVHELAWLHIAGCQISLYASSIDPHSLVVRPTRIKLEGSSDNNASWSSSTSVSPSGSHLCLHCLRWRRPAAGEPDKFPGGFHLRNGIVGLSGKNFFVICTWR